VLFRSDHDYTRAVSCFTRALELHPGNPPYLAAMGDALLLGSREEEAWEYYRRAMPEFSAATVAADSIDLPYRSAHPVWLRHISDVRMPRPAAAWARARALPALRFADIAASCYSNYGSLLANRCRAMAAVRLFQHAAVDDPASGYPRAALALIHTLNRNWDAAIREANAARQSGVEVFPESNNFCLLAAALAHGKPPGTWDAYLDWRPLTADRAGASACLDGLPRIDPAQLALPRRYPLVFFIACDEVYFRDYAMALIWSISEHCPRAAVHVHCFAREHSIASAIEALRRRVAPLDLYATFEDVDFTRYGGKGPYCQTARYCRLYQWTLVNEGRVAMIDADSLVRGDLVTALSGGSDISLVCADHEPVWHHYLSGFTAYQTSAKSRRFLEVLSSLLACNLAQRRMPDWMDQTALYVCAKLLRSEIGNVIEHLPLEFCDTQFREEGLVWSITRDKQRASRFLDLQRAIMARHGAEPGSGRAASR
jgi:tetratricopeptide (TPR) repeat protein